MGNLTGNADEKSTTTSKNKNKKNKQTKTPEHVWDKEEKAKAK